MCMHTRRIHFVHCKDAGPARVESRTCRSPNQRNPTFVIVVVGCSCGDEVCGWGNHTRPSPLHAIPDSLRWARAHAVFIASTPTIRRAGAGRIGNATTAVSGCRWPVHAFLNRIYTTYTTHTHTYISDWRRVCVRGGWFGGGAEAFVHFVRLANAIKNIARQIGIHIYYSVESG